MAAPFRKIGFAINGKYNTATNLNLPFRMRTFFLFTICLCAQALFAQQGVEVIPAFPAFLYQGDRLELEAIVTNNTQQELTGQAELQLVDATTGESVDGWFQNVFPNQYLTVGAGATEHLKFPVEVPFLFHQVLGWRLIVHLPQGKDSLQARLQKRGLLPVLLQKSFSSEKTILAPGATAGIISSLLESEGSDLIQHHSVSVTATTDPALLFIPGLIKAANGKAQTTSDTAMRFAALALLNHKRWQAALQHFAGTDSLAIRNLELTGTYSPWVLQQPPATEELPSLLDTLQKRQKPTGSFDAAPGMMGNTATVLQVLQYLGWLQRLDAIPPVHTARASTIIQKGVQHLEAMLRHLQKQKIAFRAAGWPELVYTRTLAAPLTGKSEKAWRQLLQQCVAQKQQLSITEKGWLLASMGRLQLPGHQELYKELRSDSAYQDNIFPLLLEYAHSQNLPEAKAGLLSRQGANLDAIAAACAVAWAFLPDNKALGVTEIRLGNQAITTPAGKSNIFYNAIKGPFVKPAMGKISIRQDAAVPAWVAVDWNYFKPRPEVSDTGITVNRSIWRKENNTSNWQLVPQGTSLRKGDTLEIRIELMQQSLRNMILSELLPAAFIPLTNGTGRPLHRVDGAGIHFSFSYQQPRQISFAYRVAVSHAGSFSGGAMEIKDADSGNLLVYLPADPLYIE